MFKKLCRGFNKKVLTGETIGSHVKNAEYAVRGDVVIKASEMEEKMKAGFKFPFNEFTACNIGNPQYLGQKPIT